MRWIVAVWMDDESPECEGGGKWSWKVMKENGDDLRYAFGVKTRELACREALASLLVSM